MAYLDSVTRLGPGGGPRPQYAGFSPAAATAVVTGTSFTEADLVSGHQTVITLSNDTWVAAGASFDAVRQAIIDGDTSAQSETFGFNNEIRDKQSVTGVARTSDTVVTITWSAAPAYDITADEVRTVTIPATALTGGNAVVASPNIGVTADVDATQTGGISRRRRRYLVEIDGKWFDAGNISEVQSLLGEAKEIAEQAAQRDVVNAPQKVRIKPPKIRVVTGSGSQTSSVTIQRDVASTQRAINKIYLDAQKEVEQIREISRLMHKKIEAEEEEEIISLLLM